MGVPMDYFGNTDILQVWTDLLCSPLGAMLVGLTLLSILVNNLGRSGRRASPPSRRGRSYCRSPRSARSSRAWQPREIPAYNSVGATSPLEEMLRLSPGGFEEFVADLFRRRGYAVQVVGQEGDHGVDLVVTSPNNERELVQCKRWRRKWIGEPIVRDFYGALMHDGAAARGYIVTTSFFSNAARAWAKGKPLTLIDGKELSGATEQILALERRAQMSASATITKPRTREAR